MRAFELESNYKPCSDQAQAIVRLLSRAGLGIAATAGDSWILLRAEFLEARVIADRVPDRVETQQCERNGVTAARHVEQLSNQWDCLIGVAEMRVDLSERE